MSMRVVCLTVLTLLPCAFVEGQTADTAISAQQEASAALQKVVSFYRISVGYQGAYLWKYASDLTQQEGEEVATRTSGWTQPPGTPAVGEAYLTAWRLCEQQVCLDAAVQTAHALVNSQLKSGGWSSGFDLASAGRRKYAYRVDSEVDSENFRRNNQTTFDDNKSQSALTLLMHVDEALLFSDAKIHEAVQYAISHMLAAQYPNGAWPQQYSEAPVAADYPILAATYPETWPRTYLRARYTAYYTLNDNNMSDIVDMLFEAERIYQRDDCRKAAMRTGEFFLLAQMPDPQPGWAQQYNSQMEPVWARKFEPASITGGESQAVMKTLIKISQFTGQKKFLDPIPRAVAYYRKSLLSDGQLARFYELKTNTPLYFTKGYQLTYSDKDVPTHYGFKVKSGLDSIERQYQNIEQQYQNFIATDTSKLKPVIKATTPVKLTKDILTDAQNAIADLDSRGAWVSPAKMQHSDGEIDVIGMQTFIRNLVKLARLAGATNDSG